MADGGSLVPACGSGRYREARGQKRSRETLHILDLDFLGGWCGESMTWGNAQIFIPGVPCRWSNLTPHPSTHTSWKGGRREIGPRLRTRRLSHVDRYNKMKTIAGGNRTRSLSRELMKDHRVLILRVEETCSTTQVQKSSQGSKDERAPPYSQ